MAAAPALHLRGLSIALTVALAPGLVLGLAGCSTNADQLSSAFVDPARYALYDCKQLIVEYRSVVTRENELRDLMEKARQGAGGAFTAEVAYGSDYLTIHGRRQGIEEKARDNNCNLTPPEKSVPAVAEVKPPRARR